MRIKLCSKFMKLMTRLLMIHCRKVTAVHKFDSG